MANENHYPSVQVIERAFPAGNATPTLVSAYGAFIGRSDQGPLDPTPVTSWSEFTRLYGSNYGDLHHAVYDFFQNGGRGTRAYISRIEGTGAVAAELDVFDATIALPLEGSETPLFTATAISPGAWGNKLRLQTSVRDAANFRFDVSLFRLPNDVTEFDHTKRNAEYLVDQWVDVSLFPDDPRYFYDLANRPSATGSQYALFSGQSYDPLSSSRPMPGTAGGYAFTSGVNGSYAAPFDPAVAYAAAASELSNIDGPLVLNLPGMTTASIVSTMIQFAAGRGNIFMVCDTPFGLDPAAAVTYGSTDIGLGGYNSSVPSYSGVYYPWVHLPAIGATIPGRTTLRPPGGAIVGAMMAVDANPGVFRAPAGTRAVLAGAVSLERTLDESALTVLNAGHINALRSIAGRGICIMGARTLKKSGRDMYVPVRRSLIEITENLKRLTEFAVFENNNETLWDQIRGVCSSYLSEFWQKGGLKGATTDDAYYVRCDATNNSAASIDSGTVNIDIGVALSVPAEFIIISIGQFEGGTSATTSI